MSRWTNFGIVTIVVLALTQLASSHPYYLNKIPNGRNITNPCNPKSLWNGVGHQNEFGGGPRNAFGKAFQLHNHTWTKELCGLDSDNDGKTNGEELGDPMCEWTPGATPYTNQGLRHPGICEPIDDPECMRLNDFLDCGQEEFKCDAMMELDVITHELKMNKTKVPPKETTYMCQKLDLPTDKDYHIVATTPLLDNLDVIHHILIYACTDDAKLGDEFDSPKNCFMSSREGCESLIGLWTVGDHGTCLHQNAGFRIGKTSFKTAIIEVHWNNPELRSDYFDGSGITLHITPKLRDNDAGMIMYGQSLLIIPPGRKSHVINGTCPSMCTEQYMSGPINIVGAINHMHNLGIEAHAVLKHHETGKITELAADETYSYNSPVFHMYDDPIEMNRGDELHVMCNYQSTSRTRTTFYGEATSDEMCFSFVMYYPRDNWLTESCTATGPVGSCEWDSPVVAGCELKSLDPSQPDSLMMFYNVSTLCMAGYCLEECKDYLRKQVLTNKCFSQPELRYIFQTEMRQNSGPDPLATMEFWFKLETCLAEIDKEEECKGGSTDPPVVGGAKTHTAFPFAVVVVWAVVMMI